MAFGGLQGVKKIEFFSLTSNLLIHFSFIYPIELGALLDAMTGADSRSNCQLTGNFSNSEKKKRTLDLEQKLRIYQWKREMVRWCQPQSSTSPLQIFIPPPILHPPSFFPYTDPKKGVSGVISRTGDIILLSSWVRHHAQTGRVTWTLNVHLVEDID